jgi:hypothetical protein
MSALRERSLRYVLEVREAAGPQELPVNFYIVLLKDKRYVAVGYRREHRNLAPWATKRGGWRRRVKRELVRAAPRSRELSGRVTDPSRDRLLLRVVGEFAPPVLAGVIGGSVCGSKNLKRRAAKSGDFSGDDQVAGVRIRRGYLYCICATGDEVSGLRQRRYSREGQRHQLQYGNDAEFPH